LKQNRNSSRFLRRAHTTTKDGCYYYNNGNPLSDQFPSKISFNVRIHGIPLHYWHEGTILTIGKELGSCTIRDEKEAKIWVEVNGLEPLIMKIEIELPTEYVTEVEFEYIKLEKHCFSCFSLFHEESDCPHRPSHALPPKERKLGITQCIALQRIEAEKKRHDDRRGYSRSDVPRTTFKPSSDSRSYSRREVSRVDSGRYYARKENQTREHSILSRNARSNSAYYSNNAPSFQYQAVERNRTSSGSSASRQIPMPQPVAPETRGDTPNNPGTYPQNVQSGEITPTRTLRERLGPTSAGTTSGSKERRSALARISEPPATTEQPARRTPSFESGRLQLNDNRATEATTDQGNMEPLSEERLPATLRLGSSITAPPTRRGVISIAPQSKAAGKRKVSKTPRRVVRSPRCILIQSIRKPTEARSTTVTKRRLVVDKDPTLPCNKAGTSNAVSSRLRKKNGQPTTVFIPGITRGGVDFRPHQSSLP
ncbi:unnamed protein product, partial [Brassica oleracea]